MKILDMEIVFDRMSMVDRMFHSEVDFDLRSRIFIYFRNAKIYDVDGGSADDSLLEELDHRLEKIKSVKDSLPDYYDMSFEMDLYVSLSAGGVVLKMATQTHQQIGGRATVDAIRDKASLGKMNNESTLG